MRFKKTFALLLSSVMSLSLLASCNSSTKNAVTDSSANISSEINSETSKPSSQKTVGNDVLDENQTLTLVMTTPSNLDVNYGGSRALLTQVDEGLVRNFTNEKGDYLEPAGAESWDISDDGLDWTFHLRTNAKWSDGKPVTAQHYKDSWLRLLNPDNGYDYAYLLFNVVNGEEYYNGQASAEDVAITAVNDFTLNIKFKEASPQFLQQLIIIALYPVRLDAIEAGGDTWTSDCTKQLYNGPFIIEELVLDSTMKMVKNEYYWDAENVHLTEVNTVTSTEASTKAQLFETKQIDAVNADNEYVGKWTETAATGAFEAIAHDYGMTSMIAFNHTTGGPSGLMQNIKIRKAIGCSIDRQEFIDTVYGRYSPAYSLVPNGMQIDGKEYRPQVAEQFKPIYDEYAGDTAKIRALFQEGLDELGIDTKIEDITLSFLFGGSTSTDKTAQEYLQQALQNKLGITIKLNVSSDSNMFRSERSSGNYDIMLGGWYSDYNDPLDLMDLFVSNSSFSVAFGNYSSKVFDSYYSQLVGENDQAKRLELYSQMENTLIADDVGIVSLYYMDSRLFQHNYVKNMFTPMFGPAFEFTRAYISGRK